MIAKFFPPFVVVTIVLWAFQAQALMTIDITKGHAEPLPIAITGLSGAAGEPAQIGEDIAQVVSADLSRSGLFRPIDQAAFIEQVNNDGVTVPKFSSWRQINAAGLVTGMIKVTNDQMTVEFRLWDVFSEQQLAGRSYNTTVSNWRRVSHLIADEIYKRLTGEDGYFDTRIVYVAESGPAKMRIKRLAIMDQDGENHKFLTDGKFMALTPRFSPTSQQIIYLSYVNNKPRVYIHDINTGRSKILGDFPGMSFAPRFSPDGKKAIMSVATNGNSEIYVLDIQTQRKTRLTTNPAIDTSPSYAPEGQQIVFNSDRGGSQQLYVMNSDGSDVKRISFGDGRYGTPVWSPRGDLIAFTKILRGTFYIGVMRPDGSGERLLTEGYLVEGPTWAPNGRVIAYMQGGRSSHGRAGASRIYSIDLTGYNQREFITPMDASDPAWSPLLQ